MELEEMKRITANRLAITEFRGSIRGVANGWFTAEDAEVYKGLVSSVKNGVIIEIGSYEGLSLYYIKDICKANNTKLISVDLIKWDKLVENTNKWGIEFINLPSTEAAKLFHDEYFDLIFLDACHRARSVARDIEAWFPKVKKDGIFSGHDFGIKRVRRAIAYHMDVRGISSKGDIWWFNEPYKYKHSH